MTEAPRRPRPFTATARLLVILAAHLALTIAYSALAPLGEAPDEADHWAYIVYLAQERRLPEGPAMTQAKHPPLYHATAALIASLAEPRADFLRANPDVRLAPEDWDEAGSPNFFIHTALEDWPWRDGPLAFHLARLWSAVLSTLTVWATFGLLRAALPYRPAVAWAGAGLLAFLPEFAFIGGSANNDNLAALCGTLALWGGVAIFRAGQSSGLWYIKAGWWTPLALGFGLLAKVSTAALWPVVGIAIVAGAWLGEKRRVAAFPSTQRAQPPDLKIGRGRRGRNLSLSASSAVSASSASQFSSPLVSRATWAANPKIGRGRAQMNADGCIFIRVLPRVFVLGLLVFVPALLIAAPWFWRNWTLYGDPLGMALARQTVDVRAGPWTAVDTAWLLRGWFISFWGKFGGAGHIPMAGWLYGLLGALTALAGAGMVWTAIRPRVRGERFAVGLLALAAVLTALGIWQYSLTALGTDQGRLLYPAVGALAGLLALGWLAVIPPRWEMRAAAALTLLSLALGLYGLLGVIRPAFAPPASAGGRPQQAATSDSAVEPQQAATSGAGAAVASLGELVLLGAEMDGEPILYWTAPERPTRDWRVILRVVAEDGIVVWEWKRSPGAGRYSTDRWPAGYVMRDVYRVAWPEWAGPGRYRVQVQVYAFPDETPVGPAPTSEFILLRP